MLRAAAAGLLLILGGSGRSAATEEKPSPGVGQLGVAVSAPTQPGWHRVKSDERETRFEKADTVEPAVAASRTQVAATPGRKRDSLHFYRAVLKGRTCLQLNRAADEFFEAAVFP